MSLFTPAEDQEWADRRTANERAFRVAPDDAGNRRIRPGEWDAYWANVEAIANAYKAVRARRIQAKPLPLINGLLALLAAKGGYSFNTLLCYTDPTRRELHTMLTALRDCPKTWARSAFVVQIHLFQRAYKDAAKANPHSKPDPHSYVYKGPGKRKATYKRDLCRGGKVVEADQTVVAWHMEGTVLTLPGATA